MRIPSPRKLALTGSVLAFTAVTLLTGVPASAAGQAPAATAAECVAGVKAEYAPQMATALKAVKSAKAAYLSAVKAYADLVKASEQNVSPELAAARAHLDDLLARAAAAPDTYTRLILAAQVTQAKEQVRVLEMAEGVDPVSPGQLEQAKATARQAKATWDAAKSSYGKLSRERARELRRCNT